MLLIHSRAAPKGAERSMRLWNIETSAVSGKVVSVLSAWLLGFLARFDELYMDHHLGENDYRFHSCSFFIFLKKIMKSVIVFL